MALEEGSSSSLSFLLSILFGISMDGKIWIHLELNSGENIKFPICPYLTNPLLQIAPQYECVERVTVWAQPVAIHRYIYSFTLSALFIYN